MSILTLFNNNSIEIVVNTRTGEAFTTQNGYTKLSGKPKQTIAERLNRLVLTGQVQRGDAATIFGAKTFKLIPAKLTLDWLQLDRPDLAAEVSDPTAYLHQLAGYTMPPVKPKRQRKPKTVEVAVVDKVATPETSPVVLPAKTGDLQRFDRDGIELVINIRTGEAFATVSGYSRMSGIAKNTLANRLSRGYKGVHKASLPIAEIQTPGGLQGVHLLSADIVYDWMFEDNSELARAMGKIGATIYIHQLAGFKITSDAIAKPQATPSPAPQMQLLPGDIRLVNMVNSLEKLEFELKNPRTKQGLHDLAADMLGLTQKELPGGKNPATSVGVWCGVVERAEQLGYPVGLLIKKRSQLGKWVAERVGGSVKENRFCNGTEREINIYLVGNDLDEAIRSYLDRF